MVSCNSKSLIRRGQQIGGMLGALALLGASLARAQDSSHTGTAAGKLEVEITGLASPTARVAVALFDNEDDYSTQENAVRRAWLEAAGSEARWTIEDLPEGEYALIAYQDINGNEEIDMRIFGMPKEPVGVSNDARGVFGPPRFRAAKFTFVAPLTRHRFELR